jgi:hypothetical protein
VVNIRFNLEPEDISGLAERLVIAVALSQPFFFFAALASDPT